MDCRKGPETKIFHPGLVNSSSNFHKMAAFNWLPDFRSNAPSSFIYDLYGQTRESGTIQHGGCCPLPASISDMRCSIQALSSLLYRSVMRIINTTRDEANGKSGTRQVSTHVKTRKLLHACKQVVTMLFNRLSP